MIYQSEEGSDSSESGPSAFFSRCCRRKSRGPDPSSSSSNRSRNCCIFLCCFLPLACVLGLFFSSNFNSYVHSFGEVFESKFRASSAHDWINQLAFDHPMPKPFVKNHTIVYLHVPRTAGDSLRTHLFPGSAYSYEDRMLADVAPSWHGILGVPRFFPSNCINVEKDAYFLGIEHCWPPIREFFMYKGFFSYEQIEWLSREDWKDRFQARDKKGRKLLDIFTILRHPQEKLYSTVKHMINMERKHGSSRAVISSGRTICNGTVWEFLKQEQDCEKPFPDDLKDKHATFLQNSLTYQLGHELDAGLRDKNFPIEQVLERAKVFLKNRMSFIGFFEDWDQDYDRLKHTIFDPLFEEDEDEASSYSFSSTTNSTSKSYGKMNLVERGMFQFWSFVREKLFLVGTFFGSSRMKVKKYSLASMGSDEERQLVEKYTKYDMELYRYARELTGRPVDALYDTYEEFFMHEILPKLLMGLIILFACVMIIRAVRRRWCQGKEKSNPEVIEYELVDVHGMNESGLYSSEEEDSYENVVKYEEEDSLP